MTKRTDRPVDPAMWTQGDIETFINENVELRKRVHELEQELIAMRRAKEIEVTALTIMMSKTNPVDDIQRRIAELAEQSTIDERPSF